MSNKMSSKPSSNKDEFLDKAKMARMERERERRAAEVAVMIQVSADEVMLVVSLLQLFHQAVARGYVVRKRLTTDILAQFDENIPELNDDLTLKHSSKDSTTVFQTIRKFLFVFNAHRDKQRFDRLCRYILATMLLPSMDTRNSYVAVGCSKEHSIAWIHQLKQILLQCTSYLKQSRPELAQDHKAMTLYLNMLLTFTSANTWKVNEVVRPAMNQLCANVLNTLVAQGLLASLQSLMIAGLCRTHPVLKKSEMAAVTTIFTRYVNQANNSDTAINLLLVHFVSVPAVIFHLQQLSPDSVKLLHSSNKSILSASLDFLVVEQKSKILFNVLEGNYGLCMLANLIQLGALNMELLKARTLDFVVRLCD